MKNYWLDNKNEKLQKKDLPTQPLHPPCDLDKSPMFAIQSYLPKDNFITFYTGNKEMLSFSPDGFYVRGIKIEQDENEAKHVHDTFISWLQNATERKKSE